MPTFRLAVPMSAAVALFFAFGCAAAPRATDDPLRRLLGTDSLGAAENPALDGMAGLPVDLEGAGHSGAAPAVGGAGGGAGDSASWSSRLVDPISDPYLFESPVIVSNVKPVYIRHFFPGDGIFGGGRVDIAALQLRYAVTDRLAVIAVKDGALDFQPHAGTDQKGQANIAGGVKYALVDDPAAGRLVTAGLVYENDNGDPEVLQGGSRGAWRPFVSSAWDGETTDVIAQIGAYLPLDGHEHSQFFDWHVHASWVVESLGDVRPVAEINGMTYTNNGSALPLGVEGLDYGNIGASNVDGRDWITGALGLRFRACETTDLGFAYERPLTARDDIFGDRFTFDAVIRF